MRKSKKNGNKEGNDLLFSSGGVSRSRRPLFFLLLLHDRENDRCGNIQEIRGCRERRKTSSANGSR